MSTLKTLRERLAAYNVEAEQCNCRGGPQPDGSYHSEAGLGHDKCGCYGDSGVYTNECEQHDVGPLLAALPKLLDAMEALRQIAEGDLPNRRVSEYTNAYIDGKGASIAYVERLTARQAAREALNRLEAQ